MSSGDDKARLYLCSGGKWTEGADGWDYVEATVRKGVRMKLNSTFKHLLNYCSWKCEIDRSSGQLHLYYKYEGQMYELTDDEDVSVFLQFAKGSEDPPVLYVDVYVSGEGDGADFGYGLSDSYPEVVPETQQDQQQEIHTFLQNRRPVLIIDAAHLKGEYLGTMFLVVAMDGNNNIVPVALGVGRSETADEWTWFLNKLKTCIGEPRELLFMSDRAASINVAITAIFPNAHHALCCRHLVMNVRSRAPRIKQFKTPYWKACKAYTTRVFDRMMNILQVVVPEGAQLMQEVGVERWSRAHFPAQRFNIMTSNSAESINALSRNARKLPIVGLMEYFREFQQEWYFIRRRKKEELNHQLTEWAQKKIHKRIVKSATWTAHGIGYDKWEVRDYGYNAEVDMRHRNCTCLKWQVSGLPCGHAITVAKRLGKNDVFYLITQPYYMTELYKATYHGVIKPVGPAETWHYPQNPLPTVLPPLIIKRLVGRPKGNKRRPSRGESRSQQKCPKCEEYGHISSQCPWIPNSARGSSQLELIGTVDLN
ncbi:hypothetical protein OSB04_un001304 [Centaurea solstitialis]|uniref:SWIM-type domain-containing protein n=1 Tax=Centaurea solstitialis TaxID=347529 RepID=A0AA38S2E9_9ASTR|nr:hypothetical protein OSB04_un001304 [Centaurea solstitialis]